MPGFTHASCGSEWIYVNLGDTYWLNHNHRKLWIANQIKSAQAIVLNASILLYSAYPHYSDVMLLPNDNNTRQNTACIENCGINSRTSNSAGSFTSNVCFFRVDWTKVVWSHPFVKKANLTNSVTSSISIPPPKRKRPTQPWFTFQPRWHETSCCEKGTQIATLKRASAAQAETISSISCPKISGTCNVDSLCYRYSPHHNASGVLAIYRKVSQWDELRQSLCTSLILLGNQIGFPFQRNTSSAANGCWGLLQ